MTLSLNPAQLVLSAICAALLFALGYLLFAPLPAISVPRPQAKVETVEDDAPLPRFEAPPMTAFSEVDDRSVFNPARVRVSSPFVAGTTGGTTLPSDISLVGIILDGDKRLALIKSPQQPLAVGLGIGDSIEGWQVTRVEPDRVALRAGGPEQELMLPSAASPGLANANQPPGPGNLRRPFLRPPFQRPNMNGPNGPNGANANNNNNNNNNNSDNDDDNDN